MHAARLLVGVLALHGLSGCGSEESSSGSGGSGSGGVAGSGGSSSGGAAGAGSAAAFQIADYPDGSGKLMLVPISINGSPPFSVLLDTGSDGLRVFESALQGTTVDISSTSATVEFGLGERMVGHLAKGNVLFGDVGASEPVVFHLIQSFECAPGFPTCELAGGDASIFTNAGIEGILGVSTRSGSPPELYSPFAQLGAPLSDGFFIRCGGIASKSGEIVFGPAATNAPGFEDLTLEPDGSQPSGVPAWRDDAATVCFSVAGVATDPPCTDTVFDTGSSADVIYAPKLPAAQILDGALAPGVQFEASAAPALALSFTVGATPTPSVDLVFVDDIEPFAILGVGTFLRNDVRYDLLNGRLGFRPTQPN